MAPSLISHVVTVDVKHHERKAPVVVAYSYWKPEVVKERSERRKVHGGLGGIREVLCPNPANAP